MQRAEDHRSSVQAVAIVDAAPPTPPPMQLPAFDCSTHLMHGVLHYNGYGHLARINGAPAVVPTIIPTCIVAPHDDERTVRQVSFLYETVHVHQATAASCRDAQVSCHIAEW